jgi:amidohydrolase
MVKTLETTDQWTKDILPLAKHFQHVFANCPELSFQEYQTQKFILEILKQYGIKGAKKIGTTGVVVLLKGTSKQKSTRCIGIRSDMDGLHIKGKNVHRCGHDIHMASVLSVCILLHYIRSSWSGIVKIFFQPAEEIGKGALRLIEKGILRNPSINALLGLHLLPGLKQGSIGLSSGPVTSSIVSFSIRVIGKEIHSSIPEQGINAIQVSSNLVSRLYSHLTLLTKSKNYFSFNISAIESDSPENVVCPLAIIKGSMRSFSSKLLEKAIKIIKKDCEIVEKQTHSQVTFSLHHVTPSVDNDKYLVNELKSCLKDTVSTFQFLASEDFSYYSKQVPSVMFFIGTGSTSNLHTIGFKPKVDNTLGICIQTLLQSSLCLLNNIDKDY